MSADNSLRPSNPPASGGLFRFFANLSLQLKLIIAFVVVTGSMAGVLVYSSNQVASTELLDDLGAGLRLEAITQANSVILRLESEAVNLLRTVSLNAIIQEGVELSNNSYLGSEEDILTEIQARDVDWVNAPQNDVFIQIRTNNRIAEELKEYATFFPTNLEVFVTDRYGALVAATQRTSDYYQADEDWWQAAWNGGAGDIYLGQPEFDSSTNRIGLVVAVPLFEHDSATSPEVVGVLRATFDLVGITDLVGAYRLGETGFAALYLPNGQVIRGQNPDTLATATEEELAEVATIRQSPFLRTSFIGQESLVTAVNLADLTERPYVDDLNWSLVVAQDVTEALQPLTATVQANLTIGALSLVASVLVALILSQLIASPLRSLTQTVQRIAAGDLSQRATVTSRDEIGTLASGVNAMTEQLQGLFTTMEERINSRTRDLQTVTDVNQQISTILEPERLLQDVADLTKERFRLYHSHIYMLDNETGNLVLAAGAGHVGRQMVGRGHTISYENQNSIVANAARTARGVVINNVKASPTFLPNPLLPDTRAELAMPLIARGQLIGVLDVQSDRVEYFTEEVSSIIELLAAQIATAISNARLFETSERVSRHERALGNIERSIQTAVNMDEILQAAVKELGKALRVPHTAIELHVEMGKEADSGTDVNSTDRQTQKHRYEETSS